MNTIVLSRRVTRGIIPSFECSGCQRRLEEGEFMAVIGKTPPTGLSMPIGRADAVLEKVGNIYCDGCFGKLGIPGTRNQTTGKEQ